jgi:hypothetical protein
MNFENIAALLSSLSQFKLWLVCLFIVSAGREAVESQWQIIPVRGSTKVAPTARRCLITI